MAAPPPETSAARADSVERVVGAVAGEAPEVKEAALNALGPPIQRPSRSVSDVAWIILVTGLVVLLILSLLGLLRVIGRTVGEDKLITIFTTTLAGLLGLFVKAPGS